jgi:hypothetical protein
MAAPQEPIVWNSGSAADGNMDVLNAYLAELQQQQQMQQQPPLPQEQAPKRRPRAKRQRGSTSSGKGSYLTLFGCSKRHVRATFCDLRYYVCRREAGGKTQA